MKILGIDPGTTLIGYALIDEKNSDLICLDFGLINIKEKEFTEKLFKISTEIGELIKTHNPEVVGLEKIFFSKNKKTAMQVAQARGVIAAEVLKGGGGLLEITPNEVKSLVAGHGSADKKAVAKMACTILGIEEVKEDNTADAIAIAIATSIKRKQI